MFSWISRWNDYSTPSQIRDALGELSLNSVFSLWHLIDSQLHSCLTASLSQTTLPYVLGLRTAHQVWDSRSNRYNFLTETHVQELSDQLHKLSKTSTIDVKVDYHFIREKIFNKFWFNTLILWLKLETSSLNLCQWIGS
ncbi:hypothetical protein RHGRI_000669 [Rhododendron griersonianum]|uniref:Uncharacterized protein n=1 Tax=Rhododendron griersonianum TaxID=479676 RepID=A0AAV6LHJ9_9ERIC|nr:hypothetical protein RHGRI_000669 [Rhododendron griersonianum]